MPPDPLANSASGAGWPCRMQELASASLSTPYFSFLGMPSHYVEQSLMCLWVRRPRQIRGPKIRANVPPKGPC